MNPALMDSIGTTLTLHAFSFLEAQSLLFNGYFTATIC